MTATTGVSEAVRLEDAAGGLEEGLDVGWWRALSLLAGVSMISSKLCFLLACDAGMVPVADEGDMTEGERGGGGAVSSRGRG